MGADGAATEGPIRIEHLTRRRECTPRVLITDSFDRAPTDPAEEFWSQASEIPLDPELNQQVNASIDGYSKVQKDLVLYTKHNFERIRMPLAKLEPASKWKSTDFSIAYPVLT